MYSDLFGHGPAALTSWTSSYSDSGVLGEAELATAEKGRIVYEESVKQLVRFITWFKDRPKDQRKDRHRQAPTIPMPWGQRPVESAAPGKAAEKPNGKKTNGKRATVKRKG
jgi:creatinine amidohydrolase